MITNYTEEQINLSKKFQWFLDKNPEGSLADFYKLHEIIEGDQMSLLTMMDLNTKMFKTGEIETKDIYSFRNHPENQERSKDYSQVCVFEIVNPTIKELELDVYDKEDVEDILNAIVMDELKTRFKFLEVFSESPIWCSGGHKQDHKGSYILFAIHNDDIEYFAQARFKYNLSWLEDRTSKNNDYYSRNYYPERVLAYRTWCGDISDEMVEKVKERYSK